MNRDTHQHNEKETTIAFYDQHAVAFAADTNTLDFEAQRQLLLKYLPPGASILDLGCGSGRDSRAFLAQGYQVTALDASKELCVIATKNIGQPVYHQDMRTIKMDEAYDGVWACASLLHLPYQELPSTFSTIAQALKTNGYFYASFKYGTFEGFRHQRYFTNLTEDRLQQLLGQVDDLVLEEVTVTSDIRKNRKQEKWLNAVMRKTT